MQNLVKAWPVPSGPEILFRGHGAQRIWALDLAQVELLREIYVGLSGNGAYIWNGIFLVNILRKHWILGYMYLSSSETHLADLATTELMWLRTCQFFAHNLVCVRWVWALCVKWREAGLSCRVNDSGKAWWAPKRLDIFGRREGIHLFQRPLMISGLCHSCPWSAAPFSCMCRKLRKYSMGDMISPFQSRWIQSST